MAFNYQPINNPKNYNNPSKELLNASGIYEDKPRNPNPTGYSPDRINSPISNTGILPPTLTTTVNPNATGTYTPYHPNFGNIFNAQIRPRVPPLDRAMLNDHNVFIDDMQVFNNYIHYSQAEGRYIAFNPQSFLEEAVVTFNRYSLRFR